MNKAKGHAINMGCVPHSREGPGVLSAADSDDWQRWGSNKTLQTDAWVRF